MRKRVKGKVTEFGAPQRLNHEFFNNILCRYYIKEKLMIKKLIFNKFS